MKQYTEHYSTPYYDELKVHGIRMPCFLTHIRTDECRRVKPTNARMFRMMFTPPPDLTDVVGRWIQDR